MSMRKLRSALCAEMNKSLRTLALEAGGKQIKQKYGRLDKDKIKKMKEKQK